MLHQAGVQTLAIGNVKNIRQGLDFGHSANQRQQLWSAITTCCPTASNACTTRLSSAAGTRRRPFSSSLPSTGAATAASPATIRLSHQGFLPVWMCGAASLRPR